MTRKYLNQTLQTNPRHREEETQNTNSHKNTGEQLKAKQLFFNECEGSIEKSVIRITDWHHEACRVMTNDDCEGRIFYPKLTRLMDFFLLIT